MVTDHKNLEYFTSSKKLLWQQARWTEREGCLLFHEQLYMPNKGMLCLHTIHDHHDHPTAGHFRDTKTMELICHKYHWPGLRCMVKDYVKSCTSCACTKAPCHKLYG